MNYDNNIMVSVITVCFNSSSTVSETINSVNKQSYKNIEHIFIDGKSVDDTLEIIKSQSIRDYTVISEIDNGIYDAMNKGISLATGDVISIINSDDIFKNEYVIETIVNEFNKVNSDMIYGNIEYHNEDGKLVRFWKSSIFKKKSFKNGWHPPHPALFIKKEVYNKYGLFDLKFKIAADFDLMLRFFEVYDVPNTYLNLTTTSMLIGGASGQFLGIIKGFREIFISFSKYKIKPSYFYMIKRYAFKIKQITTK